MNLDVALTPHAISGWQNKVCIVVDVLRASSTIVTVLEGGAERVVAAASLDEARQLASSPPDILVGEHNGLAPSDFHFGNSPSRLVQHDLAGRTVVLATSNGTVVLNQLKDAPRVLVGSFLNGAACCRAALADALAGGLDIGIVCAGNFGAFALDDAVCVGFLAGEVVRQAEGLGLELSFTEAAEAAQRLYLSFPDIMTAFMHSHSGVRVVEIGDEADNEFCARIDVSTVVPVLVPTGPLHLVPRRDGPAA